MSYVVSVTNEDGDKFYFAGWDGSDTEPTAGELTYWRTTISDHETYTYSDDMEAGIEAMLIAKSKFAYAIGLPEDFVTGVTKIRVEPFRVTSYGK